MQNAYEQALNHNKFLSWVHSLRYKKILQVFAKLATEITDRPIRVLEIGAAHAPLFAALNQRFNIEYGAIESYPPFVEEARAKYGHLPNFSIVLSSAVAASAYQFAKPDIVVSLETLEHIPANEVEIILEHIAKLSPPLFVCSVPVEVGPAVWFKNMTSWLLRYTRHQHYTWRETLWAGLYRLDKLPPHTIAHKGFDWRRLTAAIRQQMQIQNIETMPFKFMPAALSNSLFITVKPR